MHPLRGVDGQDTLRGDAGLDTLMGMMGDDSLDGCAGADLVLGDFGSDTATGGADRDLVIGGQEADSINGGDGEDIVNGNVTRYDGDLVKLAQLLSDWNSAATYSDRIALLTDMTRPLFLEAMVQVTDGASVFDDYQTDTVLGDAGQDFVLRPGSAAHGSLDQTPDYDAATESLLASVYGTDDPGFFPADMTQPGYLQSLNDPTFGAPITRISDDAGTLITLPINTGGTRTVTWSGVVRNRYVTDSAWNVDGSLLMIRSYDPSMPYQMVLDGSTYEPQFLANLPSTNYRWSTNPAKPTHQWGFPQVAVLDADGETENGTAALLPTFGNDDDLILEYDVTTGQVVKEIELPFNKLFSSKTSIAFVNGHEHLAVYGVDKNNPSAGISVYVVDLDAPTGSNPIVASMLLTDPNSGTPEADYSDDLDFNNLWFSPDGKQILTLYFGSTTATRSWRLLDVDAAAGTISSHAMPTLASNANFQTLGDRSKGHFAINWSHPVFALGASGDVYVVGVSGQFNGRTFPQNEVATLNGQVGSVVAFNVRTNQYQSLTDPVNENLATHVTATNTQTPGYLVVSYWNDTNAPRGPHFSGELVAINVEDPFAANGTIELAHHRSNLANNNYHALPLPNLSPDGSRLIFGSTWGVDQSEIATYVLDLTGKLPPL